MPRISTPLFFQRSVNVLLDQQTKVSETQLKISTGKRVLTPADDPIASSRLLDLRQEEAETEQAQNSIITAVFELSSEEVQLSNMQNQLIEANRLVVQAGSGHLTSVNRSTLAGQLQGVLEQMQDIANTRLDGKYIFAGSKTDNRPVLLNSDNVYEYKGDELQRLAKIGPSVDTIVNDTAKELFFGLPTNDRTLTATSGRVSVTGTSSGLINSGSLGAVGATSLIINGIAIASATADAVSTTDNTASAIAAAAAVNLSTAKHGVVATVNANVFDFTGTTVTTNVLAGGDFTINGTQIVGAPAAATTDGLVDLINGLAPPGVVASNQAGQLRLTAADGRNIQVQSDGTTGTGMTFTNFDLNGGAALNQAVRGTITLNDHNTITIGGAAPENASLTANEYTLTNNTGTGAISTPFFHIAPPEGVANSENYLIEFVTASTYNIYRESDPFTALTNFSVFSNTQTINQATDVGSVPANYVAGDTILVDGIQIQLTGAPNAGDTFTIDMEPKNNQNLFSAMQDVIKAIKNFSSQGDRIAYEIGLGIDNIAAALDRVSEIRSQVGARLSLVDNQKRSNEEFLFFAKQGISEIEDLDIYSAISDLVQQQLAFEAAQRSLVKIQQLSLFDFI